MNEFQKLKEEIKESLKNPLDIAMYHGIILGDPVTLEFHVKPFPKSDVIDRMANKFKSQNKTKEATLKSTHEPNRTDNSRLYQWNLCKVKEIQQIHHLMVFEDIFNSIMESNKLTSKPKCEGFNFIHPWWFVNCHENMMNVTSGGK